MILASWSFNLDNYAAVWSLMVQVGILLIGLFLGNILRNVVPFLRKGLVPSALIGGLLILITHVIMKKCGVEWFGVKGLVDQQVMQVITYHGLGIGFVAMSLKINKTQNKVTTSKVIQNGAMTGGAYMLQAFLGLGITIIMFLIARNTFYGTGLLLPLGFGQGPGNALAWDINFSLLTDPETGEALFTGNGSVGLTIASVGFIVASIVGVIYINIFRRKGQINVEERIAAARTVDVFEVNNEIPDTESVDKLSVQLMFVALAYGLAFGIMVIFGKLSDFTNGIAWGFNFIWGVITANLVKIVLKFLKKKGVVKRKYINNYQMDRISGFAFDLMIVAGVAAIEIEQVAKYIVPIVVLCVVGAISTYIYVRLISRHCFKGYEHEMFVTNFGTVTGTASNGMILLKEIDPNFDSPASNLFILSQLPAMLFVAPLLLLLNFAVKDFTHAIIACAIFFVLFVGYTVFLIIAGKRPPKAIKENETAE